MEGLTRTEDRPRPRPRQQLAGGSNQGQLLGLATVDEPLVEGVDGVGAAQGTQRSHVQTRPQEAIALARYQGAAADACAALMGLRIQPAVGDHSSGAALLP